ncbi:MAG: hypothetical protein BA863_10410 [Desulfovibrio sp. S3730MH75]|nr:MAG: hypothetical protein BA863_10410 [Desulfovibrio sp. S3730MH75]
MKKQLMSVFQFERKSTAQDQGLCPECGAKLLKCEPGVAHKNYREVPKGMAWAKRCPVEGCDFAFVSMRTSFTMTRSKLLEKLGVATDALSFQTPESEEG